MNKGQARTEPIDFVYEHLVCEFDHWDMCLKGLVQVGDEFFACFVTDDSVYGDRDPPEYTLHPVDMSDEKSKEYLEDYRVAYKHWFFENGKRPWAYDGRDHGWFAEKWPDGNPILRQIEDVETE